MDQSEIAGSVEPIGLLSSEARGQGIVRSDTRAGDVLRCPQVSPGPQQGRAVMGPG